MTSDSEVLSQAEKIHASAVVWDQTFPATPACGSLDSHLNALDRMSDAGYSAVSITVASDPDDTIGTLRRIAQWRRLIREMSDKFVLLERVRDVIDAKAHGKLAIGFHFQGTTPFDRDVGLVEVFYKLGVRHALMAYNQKNHVGDGCHERTDAGLSRFGREIVAEMQRVGMLVDCTHTGHRTSLDVFEMATAPVIYSHSNAVSLKAHQRNIDDELARACARTGGVVGVNGIGIFLGDNDDSTDALFRHVDHWVQLIGPEHVGIGLDSVSQPAVLAAVVHREASKYPTGQNYEVTEIRVVKPEQIPELTERMVQAGYTEDAIRAVLGGNWMRLARDVWR
ncbi:MAG: membrane dipeptidase [Mesorhizobium sp.]